jgi:AraC-like DNA-binding protein
MADERSYQEWRSALLPATVWRAESPGAGSPDGVSAGGESVILPDGCMDIIWFGDGFLVAGPDTAPNVYRSSRRHVLSAVRFDPGVAPSVLGVAADELRDDRPLLDQVWPRTRVRSWRESMLRAADPAAVLESLVAGELVERGRAPEWIGPSVAMLRSGASVERTARAVGLSARQFQRRSSTRFGYPAKLLQRILRVNDAAASIRSGHSPSDAAHVHGFADYAHLQRESRALLGRSPVSFRGTGRSDRAGQPSADGSAA